MIHWLERGVEVQRLSLFLLSASVLLALTIPNRGAAGGAEVCFGDCSGDGRVAVNEIVLLVRISLGVESLDACARSVPLAAPRIDDLIRAVRNLLEGCSVDVATATPTPTVTAAPTTVIEGGMLTAGRVLRIEFATTPPFVESLPNTLYALLGNGERLQPYGMMTGELYDGDVLLGVSVSSVGCCGTGIYSFHPAPVTWRTADSPWNFPAGDPASVDFASLHDGSIDGRIDITIDSGSVVFDLDAVALVFIHATFANGGSTIPPAPVLRSVRILGAPPVDSTPTVRTETPAATATATATRTASRTPTQTEDDDD